MFNFKSLTKLALEDSVSRLVHGFERSAAHYPETLLHISEEYNAQLHRCEDPKELADRLLSYDVWNTQGLTNPFVCSFVMTAKPRTTSGKSLHVFLLLSPVRGFFLLYFHRCRPVHLKSQWYQVGINISLGLSKKYFMCFVAEGAWRSVWGCVAIIRARAGAEMAGWGLKLFIWLVKWSGICWSLEICNKILLSTSFNFQTNLLKNSVYNSPQKKDLPV
jgi:hypothetical protein